MAGRMPASSRSAQPASHTVCQPLCRREQIRRGVLGYCSQPVLVGRLWAKTQRPGSASKSPKIFAAPALLTVVPASTATVVVVPNATGGRALPGIVTSRHASATEVTRPAPTITERTSRSIHCRSNLRQRQQIAHPLAHRPGACSTGLVPNRHRFDSWPRPDHGDDRRLAHDWTHSGPEGLPRRGTSGDCWWWTTLVLTAARSRVGSAHVAAHG